MGFSWALAMLMALGFESFGHSISQAFTALHQLNIRFFMNLIRYYYGVLTK